MLFPLCLLVFLKGYSWKELSCEKGTSQRDQWDYSSIVTFYIFLSIHCKKFFVVVNIIFAQLGFGEIA